MKDLWAEKDHDHCIDIVLKGHWKSDGVHVIISCEFSDPIHSWVSSQLRWHPIVIAEFKSMSSLWRETDTNPHSMLFSCLQWNNGEYNWTTKTWGWHYCLAFPLQRVNTQGKEHSLVVEENHLVTPVSLHFQWSEHLDTLGKILELNKTRHWNHQHNIRVSRRYHQFKNLQKSHSKVIQDRVRYDSFQ